MRHDGSVSHTSNFFCLSSECLKLDFTHHQNMSPTFGAAASDRPEQPDLDALRAEYAAYARVAIVILWSFYAVGIFITVLRTYARVKAVGGWKRFEADDYLVWLAVVGIYFQ
jgi:hypothetical protein